MPIPQNGINGNFGERETMTDLLLCPGCGKDHHPDSSCLTCDAEHDIGRIDELLEKCYTDIHEINGVLVRVDTVIEKW